MKQIIIDIIKSKDPVPEEKGGFLIDASDIEAIANEICEALQAVPS